MVGSVFFSPASEDPQPRRSELTLLPATEETPSSPTRKWQACMKPHFTLQHRLAQIIYPKGVLKIEAIVLELSQARQCPRNRVPSPGSHWRVAQHVVQVYIGSLINTPKATPLGGLPSIRPAVVLLVLVVMARIFIKRAVMRRCGCVRRRE